MAGPVGAPIHGQFLPIQDNPMLMQGNPMLMQGNMMSMQGGPLLIEESKDPQPFYGQMSDPQIG